MGIELYVCTNVTGKTLHKEGIKNIFFLSSPCQLFWAFLLGILLVLESCSDGLSTPHAMTGSGGTLFKATDYT